MTLRLRSWAAMHPGTRRARSEDACVDRADLGVWAVADGAGGHDSGALASGMLAETLGAIPPGLGAADMLVEIRTRVGAVHDRLLAEAAQRGPQVLIASTVVVLCIRGNHFACLWAGDSRAYRLSGGVLQRITHDHSLVQELIDAHQLAAADAENHPRANVITRAIGAEAAEAFVLDKTTDEVRPGDRFLICSDGLTKSVSEEVIAGLLGADGQDMAERLIAAALDREARDNVTAVVVEVYDDPFGEA